MLPSLPPARSAFDALDEVEKAPALVLAQRARLHEADHVPHLALAFLVVDLEPVPASHVLAVVQVLDEPLDLSDHRFLHGRADDRAGHHLAPPSIPLLILYRHALGSPWPESLRTPFRCSVRIFRKRAMSRLRSRIRSGVWS